MEEKAKEYLKKLLNGNVEEINIKFTYQKKEAVIAKIEGDSFTPEEAKEFRKFIRRVNYKRSCSGRPQLQTMHKVSNEIYYSKPSTASISS